MVEIVLVEPNDDVATRIASILGGTLVQRFRSAREVTLSPHVAAIFWNANLPDWETRVPHAPGTRRPLLVYALGELSQHNVVRMFDAGADEVAANVYCRWFEFMRRLERFIARSTGKDRVTVGDIIIDRAELAVYVGPQRKAVTSDQFTLLWRLAVQPNVVVERNELKRVLERHLTDHALREQVRRLRLRLGHAGVRIETISNHGYRLAASPSLGRSEHRLENRALSMRSDRGPNTSDQ